jgi:hypothetical protein
MTSAHCTVTRRQDFQDLISSWEAAQGRECDHDAGATGDYWLIAAQLLDQLTAELAEYTQLKPISEWQGDAALFWRDGSRCPAIVATHWTVQPRIRT